jgi:uncharacterized metal-binding protein YceD (DUF177 family)
MDEVFKIYVEQLREGRQRTFNEVLDPSFIEIKEDELAFNDPVELKGEAYLAEEELIIHWHVKTKALVPCSICNEKVVVPIEIANFYYSEPLADIKTAIYNFKDLLREIIVLEAPLFAECNQGHCPKRVEYNQFLTESSSRDHEQDEGYQPFANFDWKP